MVILNEHVLKESMMRSRLFLVLLGLAFAVVGCQRGEEAEPEAAGPLRVGMELQFPPFEMSDEAGNPQGVSVDIANAFGEYLGREVEIQNIAWTGLIPAVRTGSIDVIISSMTITDEREEQVDFSIPYIQAGLSLLVSSDSPVQSYGDLNSPDVTIAVKSGTTGAILATESYPQAEIHSFEDVAACVLEVVQGKADVFIYDPLTVYENYTNNPNTTRVILESIPGTYSGWGFAFNEENDSLRNLANAFIREYRADGGFDALGDKWLADIKAVFEEQGVPFFFSIEE
jgi:polar amino acid transport system substrate-binding protein